MVINLTFCCSRRISSDEGNESSQFISRSRKRRKPDQPARKARSQRIRYFSQSEIFLFPFMRSVYLFGFNLFSSSGFLEFCWITLVKSSNRKLGTLENNDGIWLFQTSSSTWIRILLAMLAAWLILLPATLAWCVTLWDRRPAAVESPVATPGTNIKLNILVIYLDQFMEIP